MNISSSRALLLIVGVVSSSLASFSTIIEGNNSTELVAADENNATSTLSNFGQERNGNGRYWYEDAGNAERMFRNKADMLSRLLKIHIDRLRNRSEQVELVFVVDSSGSVGVENFYSELSFVRKLLADFTVDPWTTRVAVVTFSGRRNVTRNVDQISRTGQDDNKCYLLNRQLNSIAYSGGGTYTRGALLEALAILEKGRDNAKKVVFLVTDGFSNGGDPRPAANLLKSAGVTIFTFGIRTGNVEELRDIASSPSYTYSYLLDSFVEFESLARRALHRDLKTGRYVPVLDPNDCDYLCVNDTIIGHHGENCCDELATCACGIATGHYACICPTGYFGSGFKGFCQPCPNGTYASGITSGDSTSICTACPDVNHVTVKIPAMSVEDCVCAAGFTTDGYRCEVITCPRLRVPENGYLVKASACSNVMNAACGIRCRIGFHLTGDSIRLCGKDGSWSGNEAQCLMKTCPALRPPTHGYMRCQHDEDYQEKFDENSTSYPIDTRCSFRCDIGYQLRGSKVRNCLPLSRWDGLAVTCKAIKCEPLRRIANAEIQPESCLGPEKIPFATNCTITCRPGFVLEGPRHKVCGGRTGIWSQRHVVNNCVDKTPPVINCPYDVIVKNVPGENYGYANWNVPRVTDNAEAPPTVWTKPHIVLPWRVKIGTRTVIYIAQDANGNKSRCKFKVTVIDAEPPTIENCVDPPTFYTDFTSGVANVTWDEPIFHDNSKLPVRLTQTHRPQQNVFPLGVTKILYNATDKYDNFATCVLNVTVEDLCRNLSNPFYGDTKCHMADTQRTECLATCKEGYGFALGGTNLKEVDNDLMLRCNSSDENWIDRDNSVFPDCTELQVPEIISQEGNILLESNDSSVCDNSTTLRELSNRITEDLTSKLLDICANDIECNVVTFDPECEQDFYEVTGIEDNSLRKRRDNGSFQRSKYLGKTKKKKKKKEKIDLKFKFIGKIIQDNFDNPKQGLLKLREKINAMSRSGKLNLLNVKTNHEIAKLALNLHLIFKEPQELCERGSVLKKHNCVKCPRGTFHDFATGRCQPCLFGYYENATGSLECKRCPSRTFTKRMHAKSLQDCIAICQPGHYSRRRRYHGTQLSLEPCFTCDTGFYQAEYGQTHCLPCPPNTTTRNRGSTGSKDCLRVEDLEKDICRTRPCLNNGVCIKEEDDFSCECQGYYIGSRCEKLQNPCDSSPCSNEGVCNLQNTSNANSSYTCTCKYGYTGRNCEIYMDECLANPCQNEGKCTSTESDYICECKSGFEGQFCEITIDHCDPPPCEEGSTCRTVNDTWKCICQPGFLGRHCNLLPCDWLPCHVNSTCVNIVEQNATRQSYRCECPNGYTGEECATKIDHCKNSPCLNNAQCIDSISDYTCVCRIPYTGKNCETEMSSDYVMHFTKSGTTDYVMTKGPTKNISELTVCLWLQSADTFNYGTVISYATRYYDNALTITDYNGLVLYVNGQRIVTDVKANDGYWHFLCITWESTRGSWNVYVDGVLRDNGTLLAEGTAVQGNGTLVIGQEQDRIGGGFSESESFLGKLGLLDIWETVLDERDIVRLANTCEKYHGSLLSWAQLGEHVYGDIAILNSPFCRGCPLPVVPFKGNVNASEDKSRVTYYCNTGYAVRFEGTEQPYVTRKCLKQGQWEGYATPSCVKVKCGFPGYFPRGRIYGWSYTYGDEIYYSCSDGYELRGNPHRICNADGKWSGLPPICIGITCKNLLAPENGDIEYIVEEHERDDITIMQAGQQLEFQCNPGYRLSGEKFLTCLDSGKWDHERPTCVSYGCPLPKEIEHGYVASTVIDNETKNYDILRDESDDPFAKSYFYGDIVGFSCRPGYKFQGNHNLLSEFKLQCSTDGLWAGFVPNCTLALCPQPDTIVNGKVYLKTQDKASIEIVRENSSDSKSTWPKNYHNLESNQLLEKLFIPGAEIWVVCNEGYELIGEEKRICTDMETWSSDTPVCQSRSCSLQDHPMFLLLDNVTRYIVDNKINSTENSKVSLDNIELLIEGNTYRDRFTFTCRNGTKIPLQESEYIVNGTWMCNQRGEWEIMDEMLKNNVKFNELFNGAINEMCQETTCPNPEPPKYGYIVDDVNSRIVNVTFKCHTGYTLQGTETSTCRSNGTWSAIPSCKPINCGAVPTLVNAIIKDGEIDKKYVFGDSITYQCVPGYRIYGQTITKCLASGNWSKIHGICSKISCGKPKIPSGVIVRGKSYLYQDRLTYVCPNRTKQGFIVCQANAKWSSPPKCTDS